MLVDVATVGAEHMERKIGRGSLRDVTAATGVSVDKVLAIQGMGALGSNCQCNHASEEERAERRAMHARLDEIAGRLAEPQGPAE